MLYLKEDDMDEMMRKAAANYEVDASRAADWNAVYNAVHSQNDVEPAYEKKKKRRFIFWWLLLIPLGWIANTEFNKLQINQTKKTDAVTVEQKKPAEEKQPAEGKQPAEDAASLKDNKTASENTTVPYTNANGKDALSSFNNKKPVHTSGDPQRKNNRHATGNDQLQISRKDNKPQQLTEPIAVPKKTGSTNKTESTINNSKVDVNANNPVSGQVAQSSDNNQPAKQNDGAEKNTGQAVAAKPALKKTSKTSHYFYAGLMAGADLSFIKYQDAQPLGYNVGLLVGYKFNKRLSVESGFYLAKKNYYTKAEYFDKSSLYFFYDNTMIDATGYCKMFEIPLNIKYDISTRKKHTWFATAGLTSYLMNKEYYFYNYFDTSWMPQTGSKPYYNTTQNWFSVLNLSAGYELKTGNKTNLRIEPYFKTTLTGAGLGNLSIESFGINAGIVRKIP